MRKKRKLIVMDPTKERPEGILDDVLKTPKSRDEEETYLRKVLVPKLPFRLIVTNIFCYFDSCARCEPQWDICDVDDPLFVSSETPKTLVVSPSMERDWEHGDDSPNRKNFRPTTVPTREAQMEWGAVGPCSEYIRYLYGVCRLDRFRKAFLLVKERDRKRLSVYIQSAEGWRTWKANGPQVIKMDRQILQTCDTFNRRSEQATERRSSRRPDPTESVNRDRVDANHARRSADVLNRIVRLSTKLNIEQVQGLKLLDSWATNSIRPVRHRSGQSSECHPKDTENTGSFRTHEVSHSAARVIGQDCVHSDLWKLRVRKLTSPAIFRALLSICHPEVLVIGSMLSNLGGNRVGAGFVAESILVLRSSDQPLNHVGIPHVVPSPTARLLAFRKLMPNLRDISGVEFKLDAEFGKTPNFTEVDSFVEAISGLDYLSVHIQSHANIDLGKPGTNGRIEKFISLMQTVVEKLFSAVGRCLSLTVDVGIGGMILDLENFPFAMESLEKRLNVRFGGAYSDEF